MNNPFDYSPDAASETAFRQLTDLIDTLKKSDKSEDVNLCRELDNGKMLGVLIARDSNGTDHTLYAFSGQLGKAGFHHRDFVEPVFDYLNPDGYFRTKEAEISRQNADIDLFEAEQLATARSEYEQAKENCDNEISEYREKCRLSKLERQAKRESGVADEADLASMIRQSQFEKAELRRIKKKLADTLEPIATKLETVQSHLKTLKDRRHSDSEALQNWLFSNFTLLNARGESKNLRDIFAETSLKIPPSGAGECCGPKLLQAAYLRGWQPVAIAEYWYGKPANSEIRIPGQHYPACRGKCLPVLSWMLQGLQLDRPLDRLTSPTYTSSPEVIYENEWFCVVNKPAGMLSVPGRGCELSVQDWLSEKYEVGRTVKVAHRLDQDTSGLLVATFGRLSFKIMQSLFATRQIKKTYIADLEGNYLSLGIPECGQINLPISPDWLDRPRQHIDFADGKTAVTDYQFVGVSGGHSRIIFHPQTGRTHQLRVHAAAESGLGMPIVGDRLYGTNHIGQSDRLHLHAHKLEFTFPLDGHFYCFASTVPF